MHRPATGPHSNLADLAGVGHVLTDPDAMAPALRDWRGVHVGQARAVVRPGNTDEVAALVRWANQTGTPLVPQGGNTGLCGGATPDGSGNAVVVCLGRMDRIRDLDPLDGVAVVEAGCILANLHQAAAGHGLMFPLGLGSEGTCQIGGLISTNAGGVEVLRHGPMRSQVLGLEVVLPDGRVLNGLRRLRKDNTGYDVKHLFIGAEGTLGIVTAAALQLVPLPGATATALCGLQSPDDALRLLAALRARAWGRLAKFEIACAGEVGLARAHLPGLRWPLAAPHAWYVITELADADPAAPLAALLTDALAAALESGIIADAAVAQNMAQEAEFWRVRHTIPEANRRAGPTVSHDVAVPVSRVPEMLRRLDAALAALEPGARPLYVGHLGDGNIHVVVLFRAPLPDRDATATRVRRAVYDVVHGLDGSISAEHGIGQALRDLLPDYQDPVRLDLMRGIKGLLDPMGLMNPGKVVPSLPVDAAPNASDYEVGSLPLPGGGPGRGFATPATPSGRGEPSPSHTASRCGPLPFPGRGRTS